MLDKSLKGRARDNALQRQLKETAVREVARALRGPADALGVDLDAMNENHFALYVDSMSTTLSVLLMDPRHYLNTEDRSLLPPTSATVKASPENTDA